VLRVVAMKNYSDILDLIIKLLKEQDEFKDMVTAELITSKGKGIDVALPCDRGKVNVFRIIVGTATKRVIRV
jgi:hypothetical protein